MQSSRARLPHRWPQVLCIEMAAGNTRVFNCIAFAGEKPLLSSLSLELNPMESNAISGFSEKKIALVNKWRKSRPNLVRSGVRGLRRSGLLRLAQP